ncbi:hypothetical protein OTB20_25345 [Streptomyces sp. H27-H1]|uniref:hypothetical protein n=1 Tax=unclassified Streptomyces TaxID=2593676 RepID=UPI00226FD914|nr:MULTISPECIES: hypothetical protein [unclassified Streptomyces]MCY0929465.1 hypothetical protein [Streptomyces sp. H27-H1]MCY0938319.1 hypothetical protein [Streptomyces sp. H34-S4]
MNDSSGLLTVSVFRDRATTPASKHTEVECEVDDDMVVIGGGASGSGSPGALLTASFPREDRKAWLASSKDHLIEDKHVLTCYAIGLSISGMGFQEILNLLNFAEETSPSKVSHPIWWAPVPVDRGFTLISGGFRVNMDSNDPGNLATGSFPDFAQQWTARSKDHVTPSKATITSFAISIKKLITVMQGMPPIPKTFNVDVRSTTDWSGAGQQVTIEAFLPLSPPPPALRNTYVLTGLGAETPPSEPGNMLWELVPIMNEGKTPNPSSYGARASMKDHVEFSKNLIKVWAIGMRLV